MEVIFSEGSIKQIKRLKKVSQRNVEDFTHFLFSDTNFKASLDQAIVERSAQEELSNAFYVPDADITIFSKINPENETVLLLEVKRGNHM